MAGAAAGAGVVTAQVAGQAAGGAGEIVWQPLRQTGARLRPRQTWGPYELCLHGGQYVVVKDSDSKKPMETGRGVYAHAMEVWQALVEQEAEFRRPPGRRFSF